MQTSPLPMSRPSGRLLRSTALTKPLGTDASIQEVDQVREYLFDDDPATRRRAKLLKSLSYSYALARGPADQPLGRRRTRKPPEQLRPRGGKSIRGKNIDGVRGVEQHASPHTDYSVIEQGRANQSPSVENQGQWDFSHGDDMDMGGNDDFFSPGDIDQRSPVSPNRLVESAQPSISQVTASPTLSTSCTRAAASHQHHDTTPITAHPEPTLQSPDIGRYCVLFGAQAWSIYGSLSSTSFSSPLPTRF